MCVCGCDWWDGMERAMFVCWPAFLTRSSTLIHTCPGCSDCNPPPRTHRLRLPPGPRQLTLLPRQAGLQTGTGLDVIHHGAGESEVSGEEKCHPRA